MDFFALQMPSNSPSVCCTIQLLSLLPAPDILPKLKHINQNRCIQNEIGCKTTVHVFGLISFLIFTHIHHALRILLVLPRWLSNKAYYFHSYQAALKLVIYWFHQSAPYNLSNQCSPKRPTGNMYRMERKVCLGHSNSEKFPIKGDFLERLCWAGMLFKEATWKFYSNRGDCITKVAFRESLCGYAFQNRKKERLLDPSEHLRLQSWVSGKVCWQALPEKRKHYSGTGRNGSVRVDFLKRLRW